MTRSTLNQLLARLHLAINEYQDELPDEIANKVTGQGPNGIPMTLFDDWSWLSLTVASIESTLDSLFEMEKTQ